MKDIQTLPPSLILPDFLHHSMPNPSFANMKLVFLLILLGLAFEAVPLAMGEAGYNCINGGVNDCPSKLKCCDLGFFIQ